MWKDRIDNPKTGAPIGSGPFLVERWERGKQITLRPKPPLLGTARLRTSTGSCSGSERSCGDRPSCVDAFRQRT